MPFLRLSLLSAFTLLIMSVSPLRAPPPALAAHHLAEISEVMVGFNGNPNVQYVEINQRAFGQNVVANTRLSAFDAAGNFIGVVLLVPGNVPNSGDGRRWIIGTTAFEAAAGIQADFEFTPGILPATAGMVCWGAPGVFPPADPNSWVASNPNNYVDCVAYGGSAFTGQNPMSSPSEASNDGPGDCQRSLTRVTPATFNVTNPWAKSNDVTAFALANPSPTNNAGNVGSLVATDTNMNGIADCRETAVGGIAGLPDLASAPLETTDSSGGSAGFLAAVAAAGAVAVIALGGAAWYARRRWLK